MSRLQQAMLLSAAMLAIACLAIAGFVPEEIAQWAPLALLAIFPSAWLHKRRACIRGC